MKITIKDKTDFKTFQSDHFNKWTTVDTSLFKLYIVKIKCDDWKTEGECIAGLIYYHISPRDCLAYYNCVSRITAACRCRYLHWIFFCEIPQNV